MTCKISQSCNYGKNSKTSFNQGTKNGQGRDHRIIKTYEHIWQPETGMVSGPFFFS